MTGIYQIQSKVNPAKKYIGSAVNIQKRWCYHREDLRKNKHNNGRLQNHYNKYGKDDLQYSILLCCEKKELLDNEQFFIDSYNPFFNILKKAGSMIGYKFTPAQIERLRVSHLGNTSSLGTKRSDESKRKMSEMRKGKKFSPHSEATKEKMRKNHKGMSGRKFTEEHKIKLSVARKGRKHSKESIERMCKVQSEYYKIHPGTRKGVILSEETKRKMSLAAMGNSNSKGHKHSSEHKKKISEAMKGKQNCLGRIVSKETINKMSNARKIYHQNKREGIAPCSL
jgi:group I intron endonuclease